VKAGSPSHPDLNLDCGIGALIRKSDPRLSGKVDLYQICRTVSLSVGTGGRNKTYKVDLFLNLTSNDLFDRFDVLDPAIDKSIEELKGVLSRQDSNLLFHENPTVEAGHVARFVCHFLFDSLRRSWPEVESIARARVWEGATSYVEYRLYD